MSERMFSNFALCNVCGALVLDQDRHQEFHEGIVKAFQDRDKSVQKAFETHAEAVRRVLRRGGFVKPEPKPRPRKPLTDVPGGLCSECTGRIVHACLVPKIPTRESDSTVPHLVCVECSREIRKG